MADGEQAAEELRHFDYVATQARNEIKLGYALLIRRLSRRAEEHRERGNEGRADFILERAQQLQGELDLIEWDWMEFDRIDRERGQEPY